MILAFPPTINALNAANLDTSNDERKVFSQIGLIDYFSGAVRLNTPNDLTFNAAGSSAGIPTDAAGQPVAFLKLFSNSDLATTWSWGKYKGRTTTEEARTLLKQTLSRVNKDPRDPAAASKKVTSKDILAFREHDYFPHFDSAQLAAGWYDKFNNLQGKKKTYYASGLNGFETVEFALRAGAEIVNSYF